MNRKKGMRYMLFFLAVSLAVLAASLFISQFIQWLLMTRLAIPDDTAGIIVSMVQGVVAAIAAGLVLYELKSGADLNKRQTNVEEAQFILEYNRSFIENEKMTNMERYMECMLTGIDPAEGIDLVQNRQDMVNYLVYLEGLASCIHGGILELDKIDNLFAYRFFLAMNHPEVQSIDLLPYATYYRGCFQLYDKWLTYRMESPQYSQEKNWDIPLFKSSLCYQYGYETYATPEISTKVTPNSVTVLVSQQKRGKLSWDESGMVTVNIPECNLPKKKHLRAIHKGKLLRAMIKELLFNKDLLCASKPVYLDDQGGLKCADAEVQREFVKIQQAKERLYLEGIHFRQLNRKLKITDDNLKNIARLIYQTDEYIYPDMFGTEEIAEKVIPKLLRSGQDSMFDLNNIYVCELNEEIVGLILWHEGTLDWSSKELRKEILQQHETVSSALSTVEKEYVSGYSEAKNGNVISVLNLCVAKHARRNNVGYRMLSAFLQKHPTKVVELCVLSDNKSAIKLYKTCGFEPYGAEEAAYPKEKENHTRITMRHKNNLCS